MEFISDFMAICYFSESGFIIVSEYVAGSSLFNNNIFLLFNNSIFFRVSRSFADFRGCGGDFFVIDVLICSVILVLFVEFCFTGLF